MDFQSAVEAAAAHTASYETNPAFRKQWSALSAESSDYEAQRVRIFTELLGRVTGTLEGWRVLDVGCGGGHWLRYWVECGADPGDLVGIDISDLRFDEARKRNPGIRLLKTDGMTLPFEDASFDLVTQFTCFTNVPTEALRRQVAVEVSRVLRPGGYLLWWDLFVTTAPSDPGVPVGPEQYFPWAMEKRLVGRYPRPSESMRPMRGLRRLVGPVADLMGFRPTHLAALAGPKPDPAVATP